MTVPFDKSPDRITPGKPLEPTGAPPSKPTGDFESYMQGTTTPSKGQLTTPPSGPSPMEVAHPIAAQQMGSPTVDSLLAQSKTTQDSLGAVGDKLKTQNLKLTRSQSHLLRNKLQDANSYTRAAGGKLGLDAPPMKMPAGAGPIDRFVAYVNDGQDRMLDVQQKLKDISATGGQLNPADMLYVQIKMNQAQQEIEYSSVLLSKVIDAIKSTLNIQL